MVPLPAARRAARHRNDAGRAPAAGVDPGMSTSNKGLLIVVGIGVAGAAALAAVYFTVISPRERDESIRSEVDRWGGRWQAVRRCLVGDAPRSSDGFEAMILREITAEADLVAPLRSCQPLRQPLPLSGSQARTPLRKIAAIQHKQLS